MAGFESDLKRAIADARAASVSDRMIGEAMTAGCADPEEIFEMLQEPPGKSSENDERPLSRALECSY